jgi:chaperonin GroES
LGLRKRRRNHAARQETSHHLSNEGSLGQLASSLGFAKGHIARRESALSSLVCQHPAIRVHWHSIPESANEAKGGLNMTLQPLDDRIVVRPSEAVETTASGLVIPDTAQEKPQQGEVLAVGPGRRADSTGEIIPLDVAVGDKVVYSKYGGTEITIDGEDLLILTSRDVLAKVSA